jgi:hypothetical protein
MRDQVFKENRVALNHEKNKKFVPILDLDNVNHNPSELDYYEESAASESINCPPTEELE